eukprot:209233-Amphidinium_carterae.1
MSEFLDSNNVAVSPRRIHHDVFLIASSLTGENQGRVPLSSCREIQHVKLWYLCSCREVKHVMCSSSTLCDSAYTVGSSTVAENFAAFFC